VGPSVFHGASGMGSWRPSRRALTRRLSGWATPPLPGTVRLQPRAVLHAGAEIDPGTLRAALERIGGPVRRVWRGAVLRRALLSAFSVGLILALVGARLGWPVWCIPALAVAVAGGLTGAAWRQAPGLDAVARFLDHALGLKEQLATALEVETTASHSALGLRLQRQATDVAGRASVAWSPHGARAGREWVAVVALFAGLAAAVTLPFNGARVAHEAIAPAHVAAPLAPAPPGAAAPSLAVRVAVVSAQNSGVARPARSAPAAAPAVRPGTTRRRSAGAQLPQTTGEIRRRNTGTSRASGGGSAAANKNRSVPILRHSESALPSGAPTAGKKGAFASSTSPNGGQIPPGATGRGAGTASGRAGTGATGATKRAAQGGASAARPGAGTGGKPGGSANSGKPAQPGCLYGCTRLLPSQLTTPGLITGKGQFTGKGIPGGQTPGHSAGTAPTLGAPNTQAPKTARQLTITSAYGRIESTRLSTKQVQGHNGPGSAQSSAAQAGTADGRTFDYVSPDANVRLPGDDAILGRYFTSSPASPAS